jgi:N-acetylglucosaminyldiphosphoundecaprenol N-acetyl-beta-D-mannosaminyltransferase
MIISHKKDPELRVNHNYKFIHTAGYTVYSDDLEKIPIDSATCLAINTISPNSYGIATRDEVFREALQKTDFLVLDGVYFAVASMLLQGKNIKRNQGPDVFYHFMKRANDDRKRVFFLGSSPQTLKLIKRRAAFLYPQINVETYSPPYKPEFSEEDNEMMLLAVNKFKPDIVFVGMTCPKQEKWTMAHKAKLNASLIISIGNVFDWFAGTQKEIAPIWFKLRIGWLVRIFYRPEVFRRNIGNQMLFFWHVLLMFLKLKNND